MRSPSYLARLAPLPGPPPAPDAGAGTWGSQPRAVGVAPTQSGDVAEPAASPHLRRSLPLRTPCQRPAEEATRPPVHGQAGLPTRGVPGAQTRSPACLHQLGTCDSFVGNGCVS